MGQTPFYDCRSLMEVDEPVMVLVPESYVRRWLVTGLVCKMRGLLQGSYVRRWEGFFWEASGRLMWLMEGFREASGRA